MPAVSWFSGFKRTKPLVLHADDSDLILKTTQVMMENMGCDVLSAHSGKECVDLAVKKKPDVILLDTLMPYTDGMEVLQFLKNNANTKPIPVLMVTGVDVVKDIEKALQLGAAGYIV